MEATILNPVKKLGDTEYQNTINMIPFLKIKYVKLIYLSQLANEDSGWDLRIEFTLPILYDSLWKAYAT